MIAACARIIVAARLAARERVLLSSRNGLAQPCRLWTGAQSKGGRRPKSGPYGSIRIPGVGPVRAHVACAWAVGLIEAPRVPPGFNLDHRCERTLCIEPTHYQLVPARLNQELRWSRRRRSQ